MTLLHKILRRVVSINPPHGVNQKMIVSLYPDGTLGLRESRRRHEVFLSVDGLYLMGLAREAEKLLAQKRRKRLVSRGLLGR